MPSNDKVNTNDGIYMENFTITNEDFNADKNITNEDFNVDLDTLLQQGTSDTAIVVDDEMERFFDDIYKEIFHEYFEHLLLNDN